MSRMKMLIAIAAVALGIAGAVSTAQAGSKDDDDVGGIRTGPLGQRFGSPPAPGAFAFSPPAPGAFAFAPRTTRHVRVHGRY